MIVRAGYRRAGHRGYRRVGYRRTVICRDWMVRAERAADRADYEATLESVRRCGW
jgi:hypothetical protein